jgi:chemotaxis protein methyltransferase CheR
MPCTGELSVANCDFLRQYIHQSSGVFLEGDKRYLLEARLTPVADRRGLASLDALCDSLRRSRDRDLRQEVVEAMTTHETFFFRDPIQYEVLRTTIIPLLLKKNISSRLIHCWSAAASSGQEAYSLALLWLSMGLTGWTLEILGTDLSEQILVRAREARFHQIEVDRGVSQGQMQRYFLCQGTDWQLAEEVRRMVTFAQLDLRQGVRGLGSFDVIFCRNVLIYFDVETKERVLQDIHSTLKPGGYLFLGNTESTLNLKVPFRAQQIGEAVVYQAC